MQPAVIGFKEKMAVFIDIRDKFLRQQLENANTMSYVVGLFDIRTKKIIYFREAECNISQLYLFKETLTNLAVDVPDKWHLKEIVAITQYTSATQNICT